MNILLMPLIFMTVLFLGAAGFGTWAFMSRQDYKLNTDQKIAAAVEQAIQEEGVRKDKAFAEAEKNPLTKYQGPAAYGGVEITYPKTWSTYIHSSNGRPVETYFHPRAVPSLQDNESVYALRLQVLQQSYASVVRSYEGQIRSKTVTAAPFTFPSVPDVVGLRIDGQIKSNKKSNGSMIIMPLRDKTLEVWTESPEFVPDLEKIVIPNLTFSP